MDSGKDVSNPAGAMSDQQRIELIVGLTLRIELLEELMRRARQGIDEFDPGRHVALSRVACPNCN